MIAALLLLAQQPQTVTFSHPAAHSSVVLEALGRQLGVTMKPSGSVTSDYFLLRFDKTPVPEALDKVASTLNATWNERDGVTYLGRTKAQELAEERAALAERTKLVQAWLDKQVVSGDVTIEGSKKVIEEALALTFDPTKMDYPKSLRLRELEASTPVQRLLVRILREIGAEEIARVEEGQSVTFSENPIRGQRQASFERSYKQFVVENEIYKEALAKSAAIDRQPGGQVSLGTALFSPYEVGAKAFDGVLQLEIEASPYSTSFRLDVPGLRQFHGNGPPFSAAPAVVPPELLQQEGNYVPTEFEAELAPRILAMNARVPAITSLSDESVRLLSDPLSHEPLSLLASKWITDAAASLGKNVVALLDDEAFVTPLAVLAQGMTKYSQLWTGIGRGSARLKVELQGDWVTVVPRDPVRVRAERLDRTAWWAAIRSHKLGAHFELDQVAAFAALNDSDNAVILATFPVAAMGDPQVTHILTQGDRIQSLRLYGRLTNQERLAARNGGLQLLLSRLPTGLAGPALKLINDRNSTVTVQRQPIEWGAANSFVTYQDSRVAREALAGRIPPASVVRVFVTKRDVLVMEPSEPGGRSERYLPTDFASEIARRDVYPELAQGPPPRFAVVTAEQLQLEFEFTSTGFMYRRVQVDWIPRNPTYKPWTELPSSVLAELGPAVAKQREYLKQRKGGGGGG